MEQDITLTASQNAALQDILAFIEHPTDRVFILKGYAGTGKTTLMRFLVKRLKEQKREYQLLASTGRAAKVLFNLTNDELGATTIHSMIYSFNGFNKEFDEKEEPKLDPNGQLYLLFDRVQMDINREPEKVYIIDESSMVADVETKDFVQAKFGSGRLLSELLDYDTRPGSKYIFVGDPCQLPPIEQYISPALMPEYFQKTFGFIPREAVLTEIMRQADDNGIVEASQQIRSLYTHAPEDTAYYGNLKPWGKLPFRQFGQIELHPSLTEMTSHYVRTIKREGLNSAVCICRSNAMCNKMSTAIRTMLGRQSGRVEVGDLLLVIQNNLPTGLMNGDMVMVEYVAPTAVSCAGLTFRQMRVRELFTQRTITTLVIEEIIHQQQLNLDNNQQQNLFIDFIIRMQKKNITQKKNRGVFYKAMQTDPYLNALRCSFGYAITCHKSQGGEWEHVYIAPPRNLTFQPTKATYQWVYTAMTRAKKSLHWVSDFYII